MQVAPPHRHDLSRYSVFMGPRHKAGLDDRMSVFASYRFAGDSRRISLGLSSVIT